jgi:hypothetical protein
LATRKTDRVRDAIEDVPPAVGVMGDELNDRSGETYGGRRDGATQRRVQPKRLSLQPPFHGFEYGIFRVALARAADCACNTSMGAALLR